MGYSTYGIHAFKTSAIICQVLVHANAFMILALGRQLDEHVSPFMQKSLLAAGALSMLVPMTAAAILRLSTALDAGGRRISAPDWGVYLSIAAFLFFIESTKHGLAYGASSFFTWDALHLIAATILMTLVIARISIVLLWISALLIIGVAPFVTRWLSSFDVSMNIGPDFQMGNLLTWAYITVFVFVTGFLIASVHRSPVLRSKYKWRISAVGGIFLAAAVYWSTTLETTLLTYALLKSLVFGALGGANTGLHIWGIFPWAGVVMLGFLIYDLILRYRASSRFLIGLFIAGVSAIALFYMFFAEQTAQACVPEGKFAGFGSNCLNGAFPQILLITGLFCVCAPLACLAERMSLEKPWVKSVSRSILWIYLFETAVLPFTARFFFEAFPREIFFWLYLSFALLCTWLIAVLMDKIPRDIHLTLRPAGA